MRILKAGTRPGIARFHAFLGILLGFRFFTSFVPENELCAFHLRYIVNSECFMNIMAHTSYRAPNQDHCAAYAPQRPPDIAFMDG
jgi:hypothetical protein